MNCIISMLVPCCLGCCSTWRVLSSQIAAGVPSRCEHNALARSLVKLGHSTPDEHTKHTHIQARTCMHAHTHTHALIHVKTVTHLQCCMEACIHDVLNADADALLHSAPNLIRLWSLYKYMRQSPLFLSSCVWVSVTVYAFLCVWMLLGVFWFQCSPTWKTSYLYWQHVLLLFYPFIGFQLSSASIFSLFCCAVS